MLVVKNKKTGVNSPVGQFLLYLVIVIVILWSLIPVAITLLGTLKTNYEMHQSVWTIPKTPQWQNWRYGLSGVYSNMLISIFIAVVGSAGVIWLGGLASYVFVRHDFPGKGVLFALVLALMMVPSVITMLPQYLLVSNLGLVNSWFALLLPYWSGGQVGTIFLFTTFMGQQPKELYEAAKIDGATDIVMFVRICLPLAVPVLVIQLVTLFSNYYNDFLWPMLVMDKKEMMPLMPVLSVLITDIAQESGMMATQNVIYLLSGIPLIFVTIFSMKYFINGDYAAGLKL